VGDGEAPLAASKHTAAPDDFLTHVPRAVHHDSPCRRIAVRGIETLQTYGVAVGTELRGIGPIGACGCGVRVRLIRKTLEPASVGRIRSPAVSDPVRAHAAVSEIQQVKTGRPRGERKICDTEDVAVSDEFTVRLERVQRSAQQSRCDATGDTADLRKGGPSHAIRQAGDGSSEQPTT